MKLDTRYFNALADLFEGPLGRSDGAKLIEPGDGDLDLTYLDATEAITVVRSCYKPAPRIVKGLKLLDHLVKVLRQQDHEETAIAAIVLRLGAGAFPALTFEQEDLLGLVSDDERRDHCATKQALKDWLAMGNDPEDFDSYLFDVAPDGSIVWS